MSKFQINRTYSVTNRTEQKLRILCPPYHKNGLSQLINFFYSTLILSNLDLISFWAPSFQQECHFP
ncbi:hypothetical protein O3M35_006418 [Rhynocoris fuscipes]|uniref:Uncharacterized protein n=1 Tax=Rhynocoris fuscipes TaxID=488301 RepID=A0AAW1DL43_9HEMI